MKALRAWSIRLRNMFGKSRTEADFSAELESHLQMHTHDNLRAGMTPDQARRDAILKLGGVESTKQAYRERSTVPFLESLGQDLRYSVRQLVKNPGFAFIAILVLAFGIGASVAIFAFVDAALIKPLPYPNSSRLVGLYESGKMFPRANLSYPDYQDWKKLNGVFSSLEAWAYDGYLLDSGGGAKPVPGARVSAGFFRTLSVVPLLGRDFYDGEDLPSAHPAVMLTYAAWQNYFGGKADAIGHAVTLSGVAYTVVGVLPQDFQFALRGHADFWTAMRPTNDCDLRRGCHNIFGIARLKDGVSAQTAAADLGSIARQLEQQYPDSNRGQGAVALPLSEAITGDIRPILLVLLSGAGLLLVIACVNVSSLLLVRSESRRREIAVRGALGASPARLVRQFVTEALALVFFGALLGLGSADAFMQLLVRLIPTDMLEEMPYLQGLSLNPRVLVFAGAIALLSVILFSLTLCLRLRGSELRQDLSEGALWSSGSMWRRFGANMVVLELAIAVVLLFGAGLLGKSFYRLMHAEIGLVPEHLATLHILVPPANYSKDEQIVTLGRTLLDRIAKLPGVQSVGIANQLVLSGNGNTDWIRIVGRPYNGEHNEVNQRDVTAGYLPTLQAKLERGRYFSDAEDASKPLVVVVNQAFVRKYFPGEDPVGKQFGDIDLSPKTIKQIVGVVEDVQEGNLDSEIWPAVYYAFNQSTDKYFAVVVRTSQAPESMLPLLVATVHQIDSNLGTTGESTMLTRMNDSQTAYLHRSSAWLVGGFATMALLLGVVGLYGVIAYSVSQRTREIGIRMALGAQRSSVYQLVLQQAGWVTLIGISTGLVCATAAATLIRKLLFAVRSWDVPTLAAVAALLAVAALVASYIPARRAASVNPVDALRAE